MENKLDTKQDNKQALNKKSIRNITPSESGLEILFEVTKKLEDKQDGLLCKICDETGCSDAFFGSPVKKFIEEGNVYTAKYATAVVVNGHIRIELAKQTARRQFRDKGSLTKQPIIIPFKDNTFDLSKNEWIKVPKNKSGDNQVKYTDQKELAKQTEIEQQNKIKADKVVTKEAKDFGSSVINTSKVYEEKKEQGLNKSIRYREKQKNEDTKKDKQPEKVFQQPRKQSKRNYDDHTKDSNRSYGDRPNSSFQQIPRKQTHLQSRSRRNSKEGNNGGNLYINKPHNLKKLSDLINIRHGQYVNFQAYVCKSTYVWKYTKFGQKKFLECEFTDSSGTVFGSFFNKSRLSNNNYYEFENMKVIIIDKIFELQETLESSYRINDQLSFRRNEKIIQP